MQIIAGVDEAGRGPLAGRVYAAAVIWNYDIANPGINDSKKLTAKKREQLYDYIITHAKDYAIAYAEVDEIDQLNILHATMLAMKRCVEQLKLQPQMVLIDGNRTPNLGSLPSQAIIGGDAKVLEISAASILAKVTRDREMDDMDLLYPNYGFARHKGYGTKEHILAIQTHGVLPIHRRSFAPIKTMV